jgi:DNA-binding transcriptional LysR family regulator
MDRLDEMEIFVAIVDHGSLAGAARRLRRSAPAVTRALIALEDRIGTRLVERTTRRLSPTDAGRALADRARILLSDYQAAVMGVADAPISGLLRVTAPVQFGQRHVTPVATQFLDLHPAMAVELVLNDRNLDLIDEGLDVAVRIGPLPDSSLLARRAGLVRRVLVASPEYVARRGQPQRGADRATPAGQRCRGAAARRTVRARRRPGVILPGSRGFRRGYIGPAAAAVRASGIAGASCDSRWRSHGAEGCGVSRPCDSGAAWIGGAARTGTFCGRVTGVAGQLNSRAKLATTGVNGVLSYDEVTCARVLRWSSSLATSRSDCAIFRL